MSNDSSDDDRDSGPATATRTVKVGNPDGLHLRPLTLLAKRAAAFPARITVRKGAAVADAKAMIQLLTLAAACGDEVTVEAAGPDAPAAADAVAEFIAAASHG